MEGFSPQESVSRVEQNGTSATSETNRWKKRVWKVATAVFGGLVGLTVFRGLVHSASEGSLSQSLAANGAELTKAASVV